MAADRISAAVYISAFADLVIKFCKKHFSLLDSCVCIKFDLQNAIFKFSVVDNTDIFDADLFCCKDGCDGCNGTGLICHIDIKDIGAGDQAVVYNVNGVTLILGACKHVKDVVSFFVVNGTADLDQHTHKFIQNRGNVFLIFQTDLFPHNR